MLMEWAEQRPKKTNEIKLILIYLIGFVLLVGERARGKLINGMNNGE